MLEALENRELFSATLTPAVLPTTEPTAEPQPVFVEAGSLDAAKKASFKEFSFTHKLDKASPVLM